MITLVPSKASLHTIAVPSGASIFAGGRGTQIGADTVTTPVMTSPKPKTLLSPSPSGTYTAQFDQPQLPWRPVKEMYGDVYTVPMKASNFFIPPGKDFYLPDGRNSLFSMSAYNALNQLSPEGNYFALISLSNLGDEYSIGFLAMGVCLDKIYMPVESGWRTIS